MKIAIDLQGIQSLGSRERGIGRYSVAIVKNIIDNSFDNEFILVGNSSLSDIKSDFITHLEKDNVIYFDWYSPSPLDYVSRNDLSRRLGIYLRSYSFGLINPDLIFITSFFEGYSDNCLTELDSDFYDAPTVSIFYDLIPLLNQELYLNPNPIFSKYYKSKLKSFKEIDSLLAISQSSANEAINFLNFKENDVFNISSACDKNIFKPADSNSDSLSEEFQYLLPYIMYSGAADPRKNLKTLLEAFSGLPEQISNYNLVLVGKLIPAEVELIKEWIKIYNLDSNKVIITGYVSDEQLVVLYRNCSLFIFPSLHEGFGLPVLEAMSCGAPVIGSNKTSIPEVINIDKAMFDPSNVNSIKELIHSALTDYDFRRELILNSKIQSQKFSWKSSSIKALEAFHIIYSRYEYSSKPNDFKTYSKISDSLLKLLIKKISNNRNIAAYIKDKVLLEVSACLDKINIQAKKINCHLITIPPNMITKIENFGFQFGIVS